MTSNQLPPLFIVLNDTTSVSEDAIIAISDDFFEACQSAYKASRTEIGVFQNGKYTKIAMVTPHWHFFKLDVYNPFKYKFGAPVQFRDGKGRLRIGNIDDQSIFGGKKAFPPFTSEVIEYHANGVRVMEDEIKLLNITDDEVAE